MKKLLLIFPVFLFAANFTLAQTSPKEKIMTDNGGRLIITNKTGLRLMAIGNHSQVKLLLPGQSDSDDGILIDCPEVITLTNNAAKVNLIYALFNSHYPDFSVKWSMHDNELSYVIDNLQMTRLTCTITLESDGVRTRYTLTNLGNEVFPRAIVSTCTKLRSSFYDVFLERTYVHNKEGFNLLANFIPERTTLPISKWLPCRVRAAFTIEPPAHKISIGDGGITTYDNPEKVDVPFLATRSADGKWIAATCSILDPEQVWCNPQLTCHHTDVAVVLGANATTTIQSKTFVFMGSLPEAMEKVKNERQKH